jgi:predicted ATPase
MKASSGGRQFLPYWLTVLAKSHAKAEHGPETLATLAEAREWMDRTGQRWIEAELHRLRGNALLQAYPSAAADAEAAFREAIAIAREQTARMWELRAARDLALLWAEQGERRTARSLLEPIYGWFNEGHDTPDLRTARAVLEGLG